MAAGGALRGLQDVRLPMVLATLGHWGIGFWAGWVLAFRFHLGAIGLWWGLCAGLAVVAVCLTARFAQRSRQTLPPGAGQGSPVPLLPQRFGLSEKRADAG